MNLDYFLRGFTILLFVATRIYWYLTKQNANTIKSKIQNKSSKLEKIAIGTGAIIIAVNLIGFTIFPFESIFVQLLGVFLVTIGCAESIIGRHTLGDNWTESYEYQIKNKHELVINGIYQLVRHPIYGGFIIAITGAFMVAKTYLFLPIFIILLIVLTRFSRREEKLLIKHFGKQYLAYMKKTKMFIPYII